MNIAVCVKYVPDATGDRHFEDDKTVDRVGVDGLLKQYDESVHAAYTTLGQAHRGRIGEVSGCAAPVNRKRARDGRQGRKQMNRPPARSRDRNRMSLKSGAALALLIAITERSDCGIAGVKDADRSRVGVGGHEEKDQHR